MKHYEFMSYLDIKADLRAGICKKVKGFYVYPDKIVNYTDHYGFRVVKGTYDYRRGYVVTAPKTLERYATARLKAEAFLTIEPCERFFVDFKDGDSRNDHLDNLKIRTIKKKFCKICGKKMKYDAQHDHCLACRMKDNNLQKVSERELIRRKELFKDVDIDAFDDKRKERIKMYLEGWTFNAIAEKFNISRQAVNQLIKNAISKDRKVKALRRKIAKVEKEIKYLNIRLEKYQSKVNRCQEEINAKQKYYESLLENNKITVD